MTHKHSEHGYKKTIVGRTKEVGIHIQQLVDKNLIKGAGKPLSWLPKNQKDQSIDRRP